MAFQDADQQAMTQDPSAVAPPGPSEDAAMMAALGIDPAAMEQDPNAPVDPMMADPMQEAAPSGLSPHLEALHTAFSTIVENLGPFPQDGPDGCDYAVKAPHADEGKMCTNCLFFNNSRCDIVEGSISPSGVCRFHVVPEQAVGQAVPSDIPARPTMEIPPRDVGPSIAPGPYGAMA